jgi:hypothetical protein
VQDDDRPLLLLPPRCCCCCRRAAAAAAAAAALLLPPLLLLLLLLQVSLVKDYIARQLQVEGKEIAKDRDTISRLQVSCCCCCCFCRTQAHLSGMLALLQASVRFPEGFMHVNLY